MEWKNYPENKPQYNEEVLVWVDGKRGPSWSNNYPLVAYFSTNNKFYEERHDTEVIGVIKFCRIEIPT